MGALMTKADFFKVPLKETTVSVDGFGTVKIRELSGRLRGEFEQYMIDRRKGTLKDPRPDTRGGKALLIVLSCVDADGKLLFARAEAASLDEQVSSKVLDDLANKIQDFNGIGTEETKPGNSEEGAQGGDGSA